MTRLDRLLELHAKAMAHVRLGESTMAKYEAVYAVERAAREALPELLACAEALLRIQQRANESGPGEMRLLDTIHDIHGIARAALATLLEEVP
jgi:hypothetical protein